MLSIDIGLCHDVGLLLEIKCTVLSPPGYQGHDNIVMYRCVVLRFKPTMNGKLPNKWEAEFLGAKPF